MSPPDPSYNAIWRNFQEFLERYERIYLNAVACAGRGSHTRFHAHYEPARQTVAARYDRSRATALASPPQSPARAGHKFRQWTISPFVADFACIEARPVIEADGGQHSESEQDASRTAYLEREGWRVIRFWNTDILANTGGVLAAIEEALSSPSSPSSSSDLAIYRLGAVG
ncbi:MAG: endonuclease domain-containing protein [Pseudomonadota bacterium]